MNTIINLQITKLSWKKKYYLCDIIYFFVVVRRSLVHF